MTRRTNKGFSGKPHAEGVDFSQPFCKSQSGKTFETSHRGRIF
jgi:hypothetical protein